MTFAELVQALEGVGAASAPVLEQYFRENGLSNLPLLLGAVSKKQSVKTIEARLDVDPVLIAQSLPHVGNRLETLALLADVPLIDLKIQAGQFKPPVPPRVVFEGLALHWGVPFHEAVGRYYDFPLKPLPPMGDAPAPPYEWDWPGLRLQMGYGKAIGTNGRDWSKAIGATADFDGHIEAMVVEEGVAKVDMKKRLAAGKAQPRIIVHHVFEGEVPAAFELAQRMEEVDFANAPPGVSGAIAKGGGWVKVAAPAQRAALAVTGFEQRGKALVLSLAAEKEGALVPIAKAAAAGDLATTILGHAKAHGVTRHGPVRTFDALGVLPVLLVRARGLEPAPRRKAGFWLKEAKPIGLTDRAPSLLEDIISSF